MTTALYRRYRPESFGEVIGQEHVTDPLMQALRTDRVTHAYLFSGPRGCGKTTSARILARCLNCAEGPTDTPCGTCDSCRELARDGAGSLDVVEIDAASHGGVDDARDLRERATFAPARDRFKIFILDEAHMVTSQGFNALLKIVEEPPPHVKFVFATTEPDKVIGTIRSRTHHYPFRLVAPDTLLPYLEQVCAAEGVPVGAGVLPLVVRAGGGSVRDSLSVLDQLVAGADAAGLDYEQAVALLGYTHAALLDDVVDAIAARDGASAFRVVERVVASGHEPRRFVEDLLERLRDLIVIAASGDAAQAVLRDLPTDQLERMRSQAGVLGAAELSRSADLVNEALTEMTGATSPRLHLELMVARLLLPAADDGARGLGARIDRVERQLAGGVPVAAPAVGGAAPAARPVPVAASEPGPALARSATTAPADERPAAAPRERPATATTVTPPDERPVATTVTPTDERPPAAPLDAPSPGDAEPDDASAADAAPTGTPASTPASTPAPVAAPVVDPAAAAPVVAVVPAPGGGLDAETVRRRWPEVLQTLRGLRMATWVLVSQNAHVGEVTAEVLSLAFTTPQLATTFRAGPHGENVRRALHETLGLDVRVEATLAGDGAGAGGTGSGGAGSGGSGSGGSSAGRTHGSGSAGSAGDPAASAAAPERNPGVSSAQAEASWTVTPPGGSGSAAPGGSASAHTGGSTSAATSALRSPRPSAAANASAGAPATATDPGPAASGRASEPPPVDEGPPWDVEPPSDDEPPPDLEPSARATAPRSAAAPGGPRAGVRPSSGASDQPHRPAGPGVRPARDQRSGRPTGRPPHGGSGGAAAPDASSNNGDDTSPDDPDMASSGLVGAPLVAQMLGGTVIDEIPEDEQTR